MRDGVNPFGTPFLTLLLPPVAAFHPIAADRFVASNSPIPVTS